MKSLYLSALLVIASAAAIGVKAADIPGVPRDSNFNNTGGYDSTRVEARLQVNIDDNTKVVHFVRDNNDPRVVSRTYLLKHVDPYEIRDFLRQMVQSKRVGNTALQQIYPGNTAATPVTATASSAALTLPATAQNGYNPVAQLGSNTAVECIKYVDGTGLLIISAEDYRFKDHPNGMGFDSLVQFLDRPQMGAVFGTQTFLYIPKYVPARNLMPLIENVGMNVVDVTEAWQGMDLVTYDPDLNWLVFDVVNFSQANIEKMLEAYDVPIPEAKIKITVYELYRENDDRIGLDFQAWKNNQGIDLFSVGGRFRDNWSAAFTGGLMQSGSERTSYFNFNPKWNTRYLDFLASSGRAEIIHTGEITVRNNTPASLSKKTMIFYVDTSKPAGAANTSTDAGVGPWQWLSELAGRIIDKADIPVGRGNQQIVTASKSYGFDMQIANASVNLKETAFALTLSNSSLIGFNSDGSPRIASGNSVSLDISLPSERGSFVIGGLHKFNTVKSRTGIPWLKDIPYVGWLFSTWSTSVKRADLVVLGECEWAAPGHNQTIRGKSKSIKR